ncbi:MAG: RNA polymerase sigma factor [Clostridia bacterium]|nr:RNA polymerase sigma factor [Clostridia bacterium]
MFMIPMVIMAIESDDDRAYMTELYLQHRALMLKIAWKYTKDPSEVDDIVSDSCMALIQNMDTIKKLSGSALRAYIVTTTKNKAIDFIRKKQREQNKILHMDEASLEGIAEPMSFDRKISVQQDIDMVKKAILALPERERETLRLKFFQHMNDGQIAEIMGVAENSVRRYIMRGRSHLKAALYEGGVEE